MASQHLGVEVRTVLSQAAQTSLFGRSRWRTEGLYIIQTLFVLVDSEWLLDGAIKEIQCAWVVRDQLADKVHRRTQPFQWWCGDELLEALMLDAVASLSDE